MRAALCHYYDVIQARDVIGHVTILLPLDTFLWAPNLKQLAIPLSFRDI